jgi:hypothetical protein
VRDAGARSLDPSADVGELAARLCRAILPVRLLRARLVSPARLRACLLGRGRATSRDFQPGARARDEQGRPERGEPGPRHAAQPPGRGDAPYGARR